LYAIVKTGGKQYRVETGDTIQVDSLDAAVGDKITLDEVLLVGGGDVKIGEPRVADAQVVGTVVSQERDRKIRVFKYKRRKHYRRTRGHRQSLTTLRIEEVRA